MMNHDGSQQYTFGYGLASTSQIQLQQQQQIQLQQHQFQQQQPQQILQHQGNPTIPAQNVFQLQVGGNPATALLQQNDNTAPMAQHGLMSQPVIHASISVSLDNSKPLQGLNSMEAMVYPQQNNGLKIITNSGNFVQQPEIHFQSLDNIGKSNVFDGVTGVTQGNVGTGFGKQTFSGWIQRDVGNQQYGVSQNALPSFGHLWSQFQQHKTQVNIVQQQQQINQFQSQPHQFQSHHHHPIGQPQQPQQFTVSGIQPVNSIQMIKVQPSSIHDQAVIQPAAHLIQQCTVPLQNALPASQHTSTPLSTISSQPKRASVKEIQSCVALKMTQTTTSAKPSNNVKQTEVAGSGSLSGISSQNDAAVVNKKPSKGVQRKLKPSHTPISSPPALTGISVSKESSVKFDSSRSRMNVDSPLSSDTVRIKPSSGKAFNESGPPKVTVTLDSLASNLSQFPDKTDSLQMMKVADKMNKLASRNHSKADTNQSLIWQQVHSGLQEKKNMSASNHLTSSTGSSLDRPSSEDSNFSSPPYSFTPPNSIDSVFSPPSFTKLIPDVQLTSPMTSDLMLPSSSSPFKSTSSSSSSSSTFPTSTPDATAVSYKMSSTSLDKPQSSLDVVASLQSPTFTSSLMSASCCSIAITTTSVTSSSPRTKGDIAVSASIHSFTPLSSPGVLDSKTHWMVDGPNTPDGHNKFVKVPYSWQRKLEDGVIVYLSPSGAVLTSLDEIRDYLLSHDTCKCGLECPFQLEGAFIFDPNINNLPWTDTSSDNLMGNLCNHRREVLAMAAFHQSQTQARQVLTDEENVLSRKRENLKSLNSGDNLVVSPLKKLRTSITNAVNKHAMLRNNSGSGGSSLSSPLTEGGSNWQKDDVFYPISTTPLSSNSTALNNKKMDSPHNIETYPPVPVPLSNYPGFSKCSKDNQTKFFSENLVYSNHHPSQRLGVKGNQSHRNQQSQPNRHTPSPFSHSAPFLSPSQENQKLESSLLNPHTVGRDTPTSSTMQDLKSVQSCQNPHQTPDLSSSSQSKTGAGFSENKLPHLSPHNDSQTVFLPTQSDPKPGLQSTHTKFKGKAGNSKAKKEKQKTGDFVSHTSKLTSKSSPLPFPSTSVSFLENPTAFVAQQAAMINNSISSCNIDCTSPGPSEKSNTSANVSFKTNKTLEKSVSLVSEEEDMDDNLDTSREDDDDHKVSTDVESNKSFSDTTENNDSAYLSQTGSDQEKSDTVDGLDCLSKSDIYDFSSSEDQLDSMIMVGNTRTSQTGLKWEMASSCKPKESSDATDGGEKLLDRDLEQEKVAVSGNMKISGGKVKLKPNRSLKKKTAMPGTSMSCPLDSSSIPCDKSDLSNYLEQNLETNSLNGDLSRLLASNNWNIPALQKVLAQHSAGDPERLRDAIQQVVTQITVSNDDNCAKLSLGNFNSIASNVSSFKSVGKDLKQDHLKQQANNNSCKTNTNTSSKSTVEIAKDVDIDQKTTCKATQVFPLNTANCNTDSKTVTTVKGSIKLGDVGKPSTCRILHSTNSYVCVPNASISSVCGISSTVAQQCSPQTSIILNPAKPQVMSMSPTVPQVSMNVVTNVSKPLSQVIPNIGINQTMLQTQHFVGTPQSRATPQLLNHPPPQNTQIMNTLSIPGLNNSLVIANPIQQASPSSVAQLSPAMAAGQIIAQGQQPLQQMSPSFVPTAQIPKPCTASISSHPNLAISNTSIPIASNPTVDGSGTIPQGALTGNSKDILNVFTGTRTPTINQSTAVANASVYSATNQPVFVIPQAKPVPPVVQLVGSSQTLASASGLQGDVTQLINQATISDQTQQLQNLIAASSFNPLGIQQAWNTVNLNAQQQQQQQQLQLLQLQQLMLPVIQNQNQALPAVSACPSQSSTLMNAVVAQQGLQVNQVVDVKTLQQNLSPAAQGFNNPALSPVAQAAFPNQIQQMASPLTVQVGSAATNPSMATINNQGRLSNPVNILQQTRPSNPVQKSAAIPTVPIPAVQVAQPPSSSSKIENFNKNGDKISSHEVNTLSQPEKLNPTTPAKSTTPNVSAPKLSTAGKSSSKSKSKSKKSDGSKVKDPQVAKDEEHIANAVNQILAQAVQQQRELSLAAQNQPPPPPKSRNRKRDSQARARAALQAKEQELGKIASISDDAVFHHQLQPPKTIPPPVHLPSSSSLSSTSSDNPEAHLVNTSSFAISSSQSVIRPPSLPSHSTLNPTLPCASSSSVSSSNSSLLSPTQGIHHSMIGISDVSAIHQHPSNSFGLKVDTSSHPGSSNNNKSCIKNISHLPTVSSDNNSFRNSSLNQTMNIIKPSLSGPKKSNISLKEHLSSIVVNKDKDSGKKKGDAPPQDNNHKGLCAINPSVFALTPNPAIALVNGDSNGHPTTSTSLVSEGKNP